MYSEFEKKGIKMIFIQMALVNRQSPVFFFLQLSGSSNHLFGCILKCRRALEFNDLKSLHITDAS